MSKKLYIVRHGKSDWSDPELRDIDRPLKNRGVRNAYAMAEYLKAEGIKPELFISSPAARAINTASIFFRIMNMNPNEMVVDERMYHAGPGEIMEIINQVPDSVNSIAIFGHNPGYTQLANLFISDHIYNVPTAGVVYVEFETDSWKNIREANVLNSFFEYPKKL
jgi:phosphohistidine phosphatase